MIGRTSGLEKPAKCTAAITEAFTIAFFGSDDDTLALSTAATNSHIGVLQHTTSAAGENVRVQLDGISPVVLGGTVTRGAKATAGASGRAVAAAAGNNTIGTFLASGVAGDIVPLLIERGQLN